MIDSLVKKFNKLSDRQKTFLALGVFALLILVFYGNTLANGFVMDDKGQIERNEFITSLTYLPKVVTSCIWEGANKGCYGRSFYYRPMHLLSYILTYQISPSPWAFHAVNLLYLFTIAFLIFVLIKLLTKNVFLSFLTSVFFITHPINSEVINWASAVPELTFVIFSLLTTIFYIRYRKKDSFLQLAFVYVFYTLAVFSKEPAILLPVLLAGLDVFFFKLKIRYLIRWNQLWRYLAFGIPFLVYFFARQAVLGVPPQYGQFSLAERIITPVVLFVQYLKKLLFPYPLSAFYDFQKISTPFSLTFLLSLVVVVAFFAVLFLFIKRGKGVFAFFLIWFAVFLSPVLIILGGVGENVFSERYVFASSLSFAFFAALAFSYALKHPKIPKLVPWVLLLVILMGSWLVIFPRNKLWKNNIVFFSATLEQNPNAHILRRELGEEYFFNGELEKSRVEFEYLLVNAPDWKDINMAYKGLGDYWRATGDSDKALEFYIASSKRGGAPRDYVPNNLAGVLYMEKQEYLRGFSYFCQSLQLLPENNPAADNIQAALSFIESEYIQTNILHEQIIQSFVSAPLQRIQYLDSRCQDDSCQFAFSYQADTPEVLPPFLITATEPHPWRKDTNVSVEIINKSFDPTQGIIILETDVAYENTELSFLFPTCRREYYEATTR